MNEIDFKVIIIPHKGDDINGEFEFDYEDEFDSVAREIVKRSDKGKNNYVLFHFPQKNNREKMTDAIISLSEKIEEVNSEEKIFILPISQKCNQENDSGCQNARKLYNLCKDSQEKGEGITSDKLQSYVEYWGKKAKEESQTEKKNNIMNSVLPFCIHCKNASRWISNKKDFEKYFIERKEHIKDSLVTARKTLMDEDVKKVWEKETAFKEPLGQIANLVEENHKLKDSETKKFIMKNVKGAAGEKPGWLKLLENLKKWVDSDNVQKQQDCCR